ncbi:ribonuclease HI [Lacticaseibacillus thailandensis]|nr:RNase H family protein [Lacticaseibacillus thailandensis]
MLKLYTDAATKGNPGPSGAGILIVGHGDTVELSTPLAVMTNHQAEFQAAALGLQA